MHLAFKSRKRSYPVLLEKDTAASTKFFGGFGSFLFAVYAKILEKCPK